MSFNNPCIEREREGRKNQSIAQCHQYTYHSFQYHIHSKAHHNTSSNATSWPRGPNTAACPQRSSRRRSPHTMASWSLFDDECRNNPKKTSPAQKMTQQFIRKRHGCYGANKNPSLYIYISASFEAVVSYLVTNHRVERWMWYDPGLETSNEMCLGTLVLPWNTELQLLKI